MKLRRVRVENALSFFEPAELHLDGDLSILIGPNGGGKTNLLDIAAHSLRRHVLTSWVFTTATTAERPDRRQFQVNESLAGNILEKHFDGRKRDQRIELDLEVTSTDVENIRSMKTLAEKWPAMQERFVGVNLGEAATWDIADLKVGYQVTFTITNSTRDNVEDPLAKVIQRYLYHYDAERRVRNELGEVPLSTPMMSLPVNRAGGGFQATVSLAGFNESELRRAVDATTSRSGGGSPVALAVGLIARKYRLLLERDSGNAKKEFDGDPQVRLLSRVLDALGYGWSLEGTDPMTNQYDIRLSKQGTSFLVQNASSGEKELLTYLFAIVGLNVRDALIVIDEPELHLHPRWQRMLLELFEQLVVETGNQFLLATHSPMFVSPSTIQYVSRIYSSGQQSRVVRLKGRDLPDAKQLYSIVNSQNNERMFFADKVVLVEGISDRVFFDAAFRHLGLYENGRGTIEIVDVGGKGFFKPYEQVLQVSKVPYMIIADLDYAFNIGSQAVKDLFATNPTKIAKDVIRNPGSLDGAALVARLDEAVSSGDVEDLRDLWVYIKGSRRRIEKDLDPQQREVLDRFLDEKRKSGLFLLEDGALEDYLPVGYRGKDLGKVVELVTADFWPMLSAKAQAEVTRAGDFARALA